MLAVRRSAASTVHTGGNHVTTVIALALGVLLAAGLPVRGASQSARVHELPGPTAFPESIGVDDRTGTFFTGSVVDGTVFRGTLARRRADVFLPAGTDGRTAVAAVKVDDSGRIWLADACNGRVPVYSQTGRLTHSFLLRGPGTPTVNDLAFSHGETCVTDSSRPVLYRLSQAAADDPGTTAVNPWLPVSPAVIYHAGTGPLGVNLNGIVASADGG